MSSRWISSRCLFSVIIYGALVALSAAWLVAPPFGTLDTQNIGPGWEALESRGLNVQQLSQSEDYGLPSPGLRAQPRRNHASVLAGRRNLDARFEKLAKYRMLRHQTQWNSALGK